MKKISIFIGSFLFFLYAQVPDSSPSPSVTLQEVKNFLEERIVGDIVFDGVFDGIRHLGEPTLSHLHTLLTDPTLSSSFHRYVLKAMEELRDPKAIPLLMAIQQNPLSSEKVSKEINFTLYHLGETRPLLQKYLSLNKQIEGLLEEIPLSPKAKQKLIQKYNYRATLEYRMKRYLEACESYTESFKIYANQDDLLYNYACVLALCGQKERALETLKQAIQTKAFINDQGMQQDSDLKSLQDDPRFIALLRDLKARVLDDVDPKEED
jgi:tetratricopeptide (TPR) repeat protein